MCVHVQPNKKYQVLYQRLVNNCMLCQEMVLKRKSSSLDLLLIVVWLELPKINAVTQAEECTLFDHLPCFIMPACSVQTVVCIAV